MKRLRTLAIVVSLGSGSGAATGAASDAPSPPAPSEAPTQPAAIRPEPPASPLKYLKAGILLFNKQRYDLASKYLDAAQMYRDLLTTNEQVVLDEYRDQLARYHRDQVQANQGVANAAKGHAVDPGVTAASTVGAPALDMTGDRTVSAPDLSAAPGDTPPAPGVPAASADGVTSGRPMGFSSEALRGTADNKQKARWLLHQAREHIHNHHLDEAERVVAEARALNLKWGYFDDSPEKVTESITKARAKGGSPEAATNSSHDRREAKARLRQARAALSANDLDRAEAIVRDVRSWDLRYGLLDDTPDKVAAAVGEARRRAAVRNAEMMVRSYVGTDAGSRGEPTAPVAPNPDAPGPR